ncbi:hypothetical protein [Polyangium jinanense]|uniref:Uncharacterized protein n=1 Tax=Polyangium jinanense TaxID=2829994 RepID=A0A9X3XBG9_9BACT|nr:hypothetical protein [Polyangium jinanense]MDC3959829.1 hypothetical protein [Polyangium jinanense]MDC3986280.1 hypothetical protein [Polyangium jinanense]
MRRLRETDGSSLHRRHVRFHLSTCKGVSPLHDTLHAEASVLYTQLRDAQRAREDAEDAATTASAQLTRAEVNVENGIREIEAAAKKLDRKDPSLAARRTIFPAGLSPVIKPDGQAQLDVLPALRVRLAPFAGKGDMDDAIAGLDHAEMQHRAALDTVALAAAELETRFAEERAVRRSVREQLESAYGRLRDHYKANPSAAEPFFLREKERSQSKRKAPTDGAKPEGAPGSAAQR